MSKITFTTENIKLLSNNPYVIKVSEKSIAYTDELKRIFIEDYLRAKSPK